MISFIFWLAVLIFCIRLVFAIPKDTHWTDYAWWLPDEWRTKWREK
ncbi:MAG: hypothetical protein K6F48_05000 [Paludibacteraceae bacterium]|nr:hypothetical protein [Paludibacteraceae bacterium]